jgi:hypothetical protein
MKVTICGEEWVIGFYSDKAYAKKHGKDGGKACTVPDKKVIDFSKEGATKSVARHELMHAHIHYMLLGSATLSLDDHEELVVERIEYYWDAIERLARDIMKESRKLYGRNKP